MNNLKLNNCFIAVHDHDEALAFYRDLLGLEVRADVKYEGMRWTTVGPKAQPDVNIVLEPPLADPNASPADRHVMKEMLAKGFLRGVNFSTLDCDATDRKSTRLNSSHRCISYAVFCLKKKNKASI